MLHIATSLKHLRGLITAGLLLVSLAFVASGQTVTATLVGSVTDATAAGVPDATVTAVHKQTGLTRSSTTTATGDYRLPSLPIGFYRLTVERAGFKRAVIDDIELQVDQVLRIDPVLQVGEVAESVEVTAATPLVASEQSSVGQVIDNRQIVDLPLRGRSFFELALLAPGTTPAAPGSFVANRRPMPGGLNAPAFQVGGAREKSNGYLIDGVDSQDPHYLTPSFFPSVDVIQEFKLLTNAYTAEYGRFAAQVNATTRAGGNELHGGAYHFLRNNALDAANFFDNFTGRGIPPLRYNQFGANLGGPVSLPRLYSGQNRTFFFASYEGTRVRRGRTAQLNVPTPEQRAGDFSQLGFRGNRAIFDPATTRRLASGAIVRDPFPGNRIPQNRFTSFGSEIVKFYPSPSVTVPTGNNFFATLSDTSDNNQGMIRLDHRFNDSNSIFFRYSLFDGIEASPSPIDNGGLSNNIRTQNIAFNYTHVFGPSLIYELRAGYNRPTYLTLQDGAFQIDFARQLGLRNLLTDPIGWGVPNISLTGFSGMGTDANPTTQVSNTYHLVNHVTLTRSTHNVKFGTDQRKVNYNDRSERNVRGSFNFTGGLTGDPARVGTTGVSVGDLLLGLPLTATGSATSLAGNFNGFSHAFFVQDDWRVSKRLTVNLGLRYELNTRFTDVQNRLSLFDPDFPGGRLLIGGTSQAFIPRQGLVDTGQPAIPRGLIPTDTNNWGPRVGIAFRPFASNRTVVRAGYGIFFDIIELQDLRTFVRNPPFGEVIQLTSDQNGAADSPNVIRVSELFPAAGSTAARPNAFSPSKQYSDPYYQQWNFGIQHELFSGWLVELMYLGSKGTFLAQRLNLNQAVLDPDPSRPTSVQSRMPFPLFGNNIRTTFPEANSTYHAGAIKVEKRFAQGLALLGSYTHAKSLDAGSLIDNAPRDIYNKRLTKGRSNFDLRHRAVISGSYELPFGPGKSAFRSGPAARVFGGWQLNSIFNWHSGFPFSVMAQGNACNCNAAMQTAQQIGDPLAGALRIRESWFNTAAFAQPAQGTFGSSGRNILDGPSVTWFDASLFKSIPIGESLKLQLRAEAFNVFNTTRFNQPGGTVNTPTYGVITSARDPRTVQFALKLRF
ncbi:MAG: carboxypeptidase regulatory-like domain-containing protein [Bryobacteraceae bacterium]